MVQRGNLTVYLIKSKDNGQRAVLILKAWGCVTRMGYLTIIIERNKNYIASGYCSQFLYLNKGITMIIFDPIGGVNFHYFTGFILNGEFTCSLNN